MNTFKAMQITEPGRMELVERPVPVPGYGEVLLKVEACGICGADSGAVEGLEKNTTYPRIPGHEVVGRILSLGQGVPSYLSEGQRVGVGRLGGYCGECEQCRQGQFVLCTDQPVTGSSCDGGYAEIMLARATGLVLIPDDLLSAEAAPLLCAGIATFNALTKSGARPGDTVVIQGIGGLGHLAIQYAQKMGYKVIAVGRGSDIRQDALSATVAARIEHTNGLVMVYPFLLSVVSKATGCGLVSLRSSRRRIWLDLIGSGCGRRQRFTQRLIHRNDLLLLGHNDLLRNTPELLVLPYRNSATAISMAP